MASTYTTHNVLLESADFNVLILELPDEDVNERLSHLVYERGLIYRRLYEDFILTSCLANAGPFFFHIRSRPELMTRFADIRREVLALVLIYSPGFNPENIVIDGDNVLRTLSSFKPGDNSGTLRPLTSNGLWDQDPPSINFGPGMIINTPDLEDDDDLDGLIMDEDDVPFEGPGPTSDNPFEEGGSGGGVPFELIGHKWETSGIHINIKQYEESEKALLKLLGGAPFESVRGYHVLVVELCVDAFSDVFHVLDQMGVSRKKKPEELIEELYDIAVMYNPFLKLEDVDLKKIRREFKDRKGNNRRSNNRRIAAAGEASDRRGRKRGIRFEDLTSEKLLKISDDMKEKIVGQNEAIENIADAIQRASVGLKRSDEPVGTFLFTGNTGVGKCLAPGTEVLMYDGSLRKVENIKVGDKIMGPDSLPRCVVNTISGQDEMFDIVPTKGKSWRCNAPHVLTLVNTKTDEVLDIPLNEYQKKGAGFKHLHKLFRVPVEFEIKNSIPADPYLIGLWAGDGRKNLNSIQISNTDEEVIYDDGTVSHELKTSSEKERLEFLAGIIDSDGYLIHNCYEIVQRNPNIAFDVAFIARSLGFMVTETTKFVNDVPYSRLFISGNTHRIPVRIKRKKATVRTQVKNALRTGFEVLPVGVGTYHGFTLSGDGRFLLGDFTVTHNTETAKALAEVLGARLVRVDCQEYQQSHEVSKLTGSPPGYVGYDDGGHLTKEVAKYPFSVVLFDEIEKAHSNFHERVLQIIDDGVLTESKGGRKVSFSQCVLIMTSNIGVKEVESIGNTVGFGGVSNATEGKASKARLEALKKKFKPEFLNRIDEIVHFRVLERGDFMSVLNILLEEVQEQIGKKRGLKLQVNMGAKNFLLNEGIDKKFGARPLRRTIKKHLSTPLARLILKEEIADNSKIIINPDKEQSKLVFRPSKRRIVPEDKGN